MSDAPRTESGRAALLADRWIVGACLVAVWIPVVAAMARLAGRDWSPTGDLAQAALRFVDFWDRPPLVGAAGRIEGDGGMQGNHPGPLMFYAVQPFHGLLGTSGTAFGAATAIVNGIWASLAVIVGHRRLGVGVGWLTAVVAVLLGQYGLDVITQLWNPWAALLPFLVFLLACWSVLDGDRLLPLVVFAGSYAVQCHVGYVVPVAVLTAWVLAVRVVGVARGRATWPRAGRDLALAAAVGFLAWLPPLVDQVRNEPGNLRILIQHFGSPEEDPVGVLEAVRIVVTLADPTGAWLVTGPRPDGRWWAGAALLALWAVLAVRTIRRGGPATRRHLDVLVTGALAASVLAVSRVFGEVFLYLFRWVTTVTALVVLSVGWALWDELRARRAEAPPAPTDGVPADDAATRAPRRVALVGVAVATVLAISSIPRIAAADIPYPFGWRTESALAPAVIDRLDPDARYLVDWDDPVTLGGIGFGLLVRLGHEGIDAGAGPQFAAGIERERIRTAPEVDHRLMVVTGPTVADWRATYPEAEIAAVDVRTEHDRARAEQLLGEVREVLAPEDGVVRGPYFALALDESLPTDVRERMGELIQLGDETVAFLLPPDAPNPPVPSPAGP